MSDIIAQVQARYEAILADLPEDLHRRAGQGATTLQNISGGRRSDNLGRAVRELKEMISAGRLDQETSWESFARQDRETRRPSWQI